jgi:hypothetical protein
MRLRRATRISILGATALAGAFAAVVAHSSPGHKARPAATPAASRPVARAVIRHTPAAVTPSQSQTAVPASAPPPPPAPAPVTTSAPPVATTGTS